jgi:hypothetical protein
MDDLPVSFSWTTPKMKQNGTCVTYCFAFIRDPKNFHVLHAGVKYFGKYSNLRTMRPSLRKTAVERLLKKPIISSVCLGKTEEQYRANLSNPKFQYNGIGAKGDIKKSNALAKFFLNSIFYKDSKDPKSVKKVRLCCSKTEYSVRFYKNESKYVLLKASEKSPSNTVFVKYGYDYNGTTLNQINNFPADTIFNLRKRAKFYGTKKARLPLENYCDYIEIDELKQFGIKMETKKKVVPQYFIKFTDHHKDSRVIFFRHRLNAKTRIHIAFIDFKNWFNYSHDYVNYDIKRIDNEYNRFCIGYSLEKIGNKMNSKLLHKKIAIDRLLYRPNIVSVNSLSKKIAYDVRMWIVSHLRFLNTTGIGRIDDSSINPDTYRLKVDYVYDEKNNKIGIYKPVIHMTLFESIHAFLSEMYGYE